MSFEKVKTMTECEYALYVAECILDSAAEEYLKENTENYERVQNYATNACDRDLDDETAKLVLSCIVEYTFSERSSNYEYRCLVEHPIRKHFGDL